MKGDGAADVEVPGRSEFGGLGDEFVEGNGGFDPPAGFVLRGGDEPLRVPADLVPGTFACFAALINFEDVG